MRAGRCERTATPLVAPIGRRQPQRLLGELRRHGYRAAIGGQRRGFFEHAYDLVVWANGRERKVTGAEDRVVHELCDPHVHASPLFAETTEESRREQRVGEADRSVLTLDHARGEGRLECLRSYARAL